MIKVFANGEELNLFAAEKFIEIGSAAIAERGQFTVSLAGGSTPKSLYQLLSSEQFKDKINWKSVFFFSATNEMLRLIRTKVTSKWRTKIYSHR
jgi:6-phosphogluconolactonase